MDHHRERSRCLQELGLREPASEEDIKKAYRTAAFQYHPDKNPGKDTTSKFQQISAAYKYLTEGHAFIRLSEESQDHSYFNILRFMFPWLFETSFAFRTPNPYYHYYDNMSDDDDDDYENYIPPRASGGAPYANQFYPNNYNFTHTSSNHGQFFQDKKTKKKAAKKRNRDAKRATKVAAEKEKSEAAKMSSTDTKLPDRASQSKSPTPDLLKQNQAACAEDNSPPGKEKEKSQSPESSATSNSTEARKDSTEDQTNKKSKKQILMEQKQRDKEIKELNEELLRKEKEKKEKMEKKRAVQEEKDRQEREAREKEKQQIEEEARQQAEAVRKLQEKKDEETKQKRRDAAKMKKLLQDFDNNTFLDDNGDFKYTDPDVKNMICRDDLKHLGNATKNTQQERMKTINGLNTENLIKIQEVNKGDNKPRSSQETIQESPNHARFGPVGSRPQTTNINHRENPGHQYNHPTNYSRVYQQQKQQFQHPQQRPQQRPQHPQQRPQHPQQQQWSPQQQTQQLYNHPPPRQPTSQMPYWSSTQPPPPLHNINTNVPRASARFSQGYSDKNSHNNGSSTRTFTSRVFQGKT